VFSDLYVIIGVSLRELCSLRSTQLKYLYSVTLYNLKIKTQDADRQILVDLTLDYHVLKFERFTLQYVDI
jgi:hypothetical protein